MSDAGDLVEPHIAGACEILQMICGEGWNGSRYGRFDAFHMTTIPEILGPMVLSPYRIVCATSDVKYYLVISDGVLCYVNEEYIGDCVHAVSGAPYSWIVEDDLGVHDDDESIPGQLVPEDDDAYFAVSRGGVVEIGSERYDVGDILASMRIVRYMPDMHGDCAGLVFWDGDRTLHGRAFVNTTIDEKVREDDQIEKTWSITMPRRPVAVMFAADTHEWCCTVHPWGIEYQELGF